MSHTLVLVGHGSHLNPQSSAAVLRHADRLREEGDFDEVRVGFWKEEPWLCRALDGCASERITVVPVFISSGYFTEQVVPREMRLDGPVTDWEGQRVVTCPPVGGHPRLVDVMIQRAEEAGATRDSAVAVLGHGTARNPNSARNVYRQAERLRERNRFAEVTTVFLDQEPGLDQVWALTTAPEVLVLPLFVADGWHVAETIPQDLDLVGGENVKGDRRLRFAAAVGTHPAVVEVVRELVAESAG